MAGWKKSRKKKKKKNWLQRSRTSQRLSFNLISFDREYYFSFLIKGYHHETVYVFIIPTNEDIKSTWTVIHQNVLY